MKTFFDATILPALKELDELLGYPEEDPHVGDVSNYTKDGITHIAVLDLGATYEKIGNEWVETI